MKRKSMWSWTHGSIMTGILFILLVVVAHPATAESLRVEEVFICRDVVDHLPIGAGDVFPFDVTKLFCLTRVVGAVGETEVTHNWYYNGKMTASVTLAVKSSNWRTYSSKKILPEQTGEWMVEVLSDTGAPLTKIIFSIQ